MRFFSLRMWRLPVRPPVSKRRYEVELLEHRACRAADILEGVAGDQDVSAYVASSEELADRTWDSEQSSDASSQLEKPVAVPGDPASVIEEGPEVSDVDEIPQTDFKETTESLWEGDLIEIPKESKENAIDSVLPDLEMPEYSTEWSGYEAYPDASPNFPETQEAQDVEEWFPEILGSAPAQEEVDCDVSNQVLPGGQTTCDLTSQTGDNSPSNLGGPQGLEDNPKSDGPSKHSNRPDSNSNQTNTNAPGSNGDQAVWEEPRLELMSVQDLVRPRSPVTEPPRLQLLGIRPLSLMSPPPTIQAANERHPTSIAGRSRSENADGVEPSALGRSLRHASQLTSYQLDLPRPQIAFGDLATRGLVHSDVSSAGQSSEPTLKSRRREVGHEETIPFVDSVYGNAVLRDRGRHRPLLAPLHELKTQSLVPRQRPESPYEKASRTHQSEPNAESPSIDDATFLPNPPATTIAAENVRVKAVKVIATAPISPALSESSQSPSDLNSSGPDVLDMKLPGDPAPANQFDAPPPWRRSLEWLVSGMFLAGLWRSRPLQNRFCWHQRVTNGRPTDHYR